jgi:hypothetical protein
MNEQTFFEHSTWPKPHQISQPPMEMKGFKSISTRLFSDLIPSKPDEFDKKKLQRKRVITVTSPKSCKRSSGTLLTNKRNRTLGGITTILIAVLVIFQIWSTAATQGVNTFYPTDKFSIPSQNGTISFAVEGTYSNATLKEGVWSFIDLQLNGSQPLEKIDVSAENSDIIIFSHLSYDYLRKISVLTYFAQGRGTQTLNIGIEAGKNQGGINIEWSVIVNDTFVAQGNKWNITPEGTLTITGLSGNITVFYFSIGEEANNENLPFFQQHSIVILTILAAAITVVVAIVVKTKNKKIHNDRSLKSNDLKKIEKRIEEGDI